MSTMSTSVPAVGHQAPDFTLPSTAGSAVTLLLSALCGKNVLLAFFPLAFKAVERRIAGADQSLRVNGRAG